MKFLTEGAMLDAAQIESAAKTLAPYIAHLKGVVASGTYDAAESSINLPSDADILSRVKALKEKKSKNAPKYIIDIGIGGSNLGTKAIYDAFFGYYDALPLPRPNNSRMIFLDTNEEEFLAKLVQFIQQLESKDDVLVNAISKSGGTTETIANLEIVLAAMEKKFGDSKDRLVITTDEGSALWNEAQKQGIDTLPLPKQVGGRFSVLSAVGLFPLAACGVDIDEILAGAARAREAGLNENVTVNPSLLSAVILYLHNKSGKNINDNFFFAPQLESLGKWYRQLMGESIGKEHDLDGNPAHTGITPTVSLGSTDLHSVGQLYLGGPKDKVTTFVSAESPKYEARVPEKLQFPLVPHIDGKRASTIMDAIKEGTKAAYAKQGQAYTEIVLESVNEGALGEFLQFKMIEMMYLGKLMNVNTFDQPHVELYKVVTKKILAES
jgi:glucose-6-phosphate isomerase